MDNVAGAREAISHLIGNGYRRAGVITGPLNITTGRDRLEGYRHILREAGIPHDPALERSGSFDSNSGRLLTAKLLGILQAVDALLAGNNLQTIGAIGTSKDLTPPASRKL